MLAFTRFEEQGQPVQEQLEGVLLTGTGLVRYVPVDCDPPASPGEQGEQHGTEADTSEHNCDEQYDGPLEEEHLLDLSRLIATTRDLRTLGIKGLELPDSIINSALTNNPRDIQEAAYSVLSTWRKRYKDRVAAFNALVAALRKCGMKKLASQLVAFAQKRDSTNAETATPISHGDTSPINISSPQQQGQREPALAAPLQALLNSDEKTLKDVHLEKVSSLITNPKELKTLGIEGLELPPSTIDSALTHYPGDIRMAAHSVLSEWRRKYEDQSEAFWDLVAALKKYYRLEHQIIELTPQRDSTDAEVATAASRRDPSPINDSSHRQQEQREHAQARQQGVTGIDALWDELNSDEMTNVTEPLNDERLLDVSLCICSPEDLRRLGIKGLKLPANKIDSALANKPGDIHAAAYSLLSTWRKGQKNKVTASRNLVTALRECNMNQYVSQLESQPRAGPSSAGSRTVTNRESPKTPESEPLLAHPQVNTIKFIILVFFINFV